MTLTEREREFVRKVWERKKPWKVMTYLELERLYEWFLNRCRELDIDPYLIDFEAIIDSSLSYYENQGLLETQILGLIPTPREFEELEYYKKKVEELEKRIKELEKVVPTEEIERLKEEIKKWKERYEKARKTIEEIKRTPGLTEEDVVRIVREELKEFGRELGVILVAIGERIEAIEKSIRKITPTITVPTAPIRYKPIVEVESDFELIREELDVLSIPFELRRKFEKELEKMEKYKEELIPLGFSIPEERERIRLRDLVRTSYDKMKLMIEFDFPMYLKKDELERLRDNVFRLWSDMVRL